MRIFRERGVADLFRLLHEEPQLLRGAFIADKVVGKGAAALMVLGGVEGLFADVVSARHWSCSPEPASRWNTRSWCPAS